VLPFVAVTGGLLEVSRLFVQPDIDTMKSIVMLANNNFLINFVFKMVNNDSLLLSSAGGGAKNSEWVNCG
jgi:hypothetical protein